MSCSFCWLTPSYKTCAAAASKKGPRPNPTSASRAAANSLGILVWPLAALRTHCTGVRSRSATVGIGVIVEALAARGSGFGGTPATHYPINPPQTHSSPQLDTPQPTPPNGLGPSRNSAENIAFLPGLLYSARPCPHDGFAGRSAELAIFLGFSVRIR
jgi:hypothetical protein